jgi:hypothetical protein
MTLKLLTKNHTMGLLFGSTGISRPMKFGALALRFGLKAVDERESETHPFVFGMSSQQIHLDNKRGLERLSHSTTIRIQL